MAIRRTKIVATIGPASESPAVLRDLIDAGMNMARISLSHGPLDEALDRMVRIRKVAAEADQPVGIMADLPGPKIRAAEFGDAGVMLQGGSTIEVVDAGGSASTSNEDRIVIEQLGAVAALEPGDGIVLGDGAIQLFITRTDGERATAEISTGGLVQGRPGVSLPSGKLDLTAPTDDDLRLLDGLYRAGVDAVAISFVNRAADVQRAKDALDVDPPMLVAKIETPEAVADLDAIVAIADAVMVARGDLGIRCAMEDIPHFQKRVIHTGVAYGRPVITATQMLESMVRAPVPTRAEVTDVANAVFDGTSAVMLSGETAIGQHPVAAVRTMARIAERAEEDFDFRTWGHDLGR
ncbi:MAG: pyruvate kinase, partial [Acidimicrobiales bacterium]